MAILKEVLTTTLRILSLKDNVEEQDTSRTIWLFEIKIYETNCYGKVEGYKASPISKAGFRDS